ncbi:MAG TPA: OB-fold nucleic acid binding domain-containing protein, partial [Rhodanobacteraceae bacterium]|nr:OB-fold nucleic acid binding domain-containing protein [Rhodanobacteraceae bacterium]
MAFVQVEDWSGRMEVSLFRESWIEYGPLLTRDAILVFDGGLSLDEFSGSYQLRVNSVATIESACERSARVLRVRLNGVHADFVARLQHALSAHRGGATAVRISYHNADGQAEIELGAEWRVRASPALKDSLQALDGVIAAELVFG